MNNPQEIFTTKSDFCQSCDLHRVVAALMHFGQLVPRRPFYRNRPARFWHCCPVSQWHFLVCSKAGCDWQSSLHFLHWRFRRIPLFSTFGWSSLYFGHDWTYGTVLFDFRLYSALAPSLLLDEFRCSSKGQQSGKSGIIFAKSEPQRWHYCDLGRY